MNAITKDIKDILVAETDLEFGKNLFISIIPPEPLNVVALYDTSASPPDNDFDKKSVWNDSFQILVRNTSYEQAYDMAYEIMNKLHLISNKVINDCRYLYILAQNSPFQLQETGARGGLTNKRGETLLSLNFNVKRIKVN